MIRVLRDLREPVDGRSCQMGFEQGVTVIVSRADDAAAAAVTSAAARVVTDARMLNAMSFHC